MQWLQEAIERLGRHEKVVLVTVASTKGSAPREAGAKMLVAAGDIVGTIGGGTLELRAIERARDLIAGAVSNRLHESVALGPALGQCCGGSTEIVFEPLEPSAMDLLQDCRRHLASGGALIVTPLLDSNARKRVYALHSLPKPLMTALAKAKDQASPAIIADMPTDGLCLIEHLQERRALVWLFGAGHVGRAVARALEPLPFHLTWVDDRPGFLPESETDDLRPLFSRAPHLEVASVPAGALVLVMSHSHALDFEITEAALRRDDLAYVGLIGSATKRAQFMRRCRAHGLTEIETDRLVSPIGSPSIRGKEPAVIAASVVVQLLLVAEAQADARQSQEPQTVEAK